MAFSSDTFIERMQLKRQLSFWRLFSIAIAVFFIIIIIEKQFNTKNVVTAGSYIARLTISGTINDNQKLYTLLDDVEDDDDIKAVILYLDTPGGSAAGGEAILKRIQAIASKKPVVASMRGVCASAGYMISLGADHVLAMPSTITGSIGVILQTAEASELTDKIGIQPVTIKSGAMKGGLSFYEKPDASTISVLQSMIDEFHEVFVAMVAEHRELPIDKVRTIADGRVYSGGQALKLGLIDALGGEEEALTWLHAEKGIDTTLEIRDHKIQSRYEKFLEKLDSYVSVSSIFPQNTSFSQGLMLLWKPDLLR